jgi:hypothetical protein
MAVCVIDLSALSLHEPHASPGCAKERLYCELFVVSERLVWERTGSILIRPVLKHSAILFIRVRTATPDSIKTIVDPNSFFESWINGARSASYCLR